MPAWVTSLTHFSTFDEMWQFLDAMMGKRDERGEVMEQTSLRTTRKVLGRFFERKPQMRSTKGQ
jgi:hypothetical protein